ISFFAKILNHLNIKNMSEIAQKVKQIIIEKLGVEESEVTPEASFTNDLGADSLDTVELIMEFEKEFNISIPDDQAENISTVGQAISYLEQDVKKYNLVNTSFLPHPIRHDFVATSSHRSWCTHADWENRSTVLGRTEERNQRCRPDYSIRCHSL